MNRHSARRMFVKRLISAIASAVPATVGARALAQDTGGVRGFDHVALPMQNTDSMLRFYRGLGFQIRETTSVVSVYVGDQMINFHRPTLWQRATFTLKAPAARPPCGDLCFVWDGPPASLKALLDRSGATVVEGPVDRQGGRRKSGSSVYTRDPDGNLLEFIIYS